MKEDSIKEIAEKMKKFEEMGLDPFGKKSSIDSGGAEEKPKTILECSLSYSLSDESGQKTAGGEAKAKLDRDYFSVLPQFADPLLFSFRDILEITEEDYKINLTLTSKEKLTLYNLGYHFEDFSRVFSGLRNEVLIKDMLMDEKLRKSVPEAEFLYSDENAVEKQKGKCEVRLYETALIIIPEKGEITRIPYSDILEISGEDYAISLLIESRGKIIFSRIGREFDPFKKALSDAMNELSLKIQISIKELLPQADPSILRKAGRLMREGRAAKKGEIESVSPELWKALEKKLETAGMKEEYEFLRSLSRQEKICIGFKRGLLGDLTGEYIWFLIPLYSTNPKEPGNAVAMEAASEEDSGKATYFFRMVSRKDYRNFRNIEDLDTEADNFIKKINRCMIAINFRREPVYLAKEKLEEPQYSKYKFSIRKLPELQFLRDFFIGRVIHTSPQQWKKDAEDLLKFNISTENEKSKWGKGG